MDLDPFGDDYNDSDEEYIEPERTSPWVEKYRPKTLDDLISHVDIINALKVFIKNKYMPHMLFYGPPGTGKTSTILACAKELYGVNMNFMVMKLNASDDRGIEVVRNKVKQFVLSDNSFCKISTGTSNESFKMVILDEIDAMTDDAQAILRQVVEKYTANARFCLICNYIKKINIALQSRCVPFRFGPLKKEQIMKRLDYVIEKEKVNITLDGKNAIIKHSKGDMRKVLNMLQSSHMIYKTITEENINYCFGYPDKKIMKKLIGNLFKDTIQQNSMLLKSIIREYGISLTDIITEVYNYLIDYIINDKAINSIMLNYNHKQISQIINKMRLIEVNQATNTNEDIQIGGFISLFKLKFI